MIPTAQNIISFCVKEYGTVIDTAPGAVNLFYLEGCDAADLRPNSDLPDLWNDTSLIITHDNTGTPRIVFQAEATSEPGLSATISPKSSAKGGVFRIEIGWHREKWSHGLHKGNRQHPALVQCAPIFGRRDGNKDGKRTGDLTTDNVQGLNQHGTRDGLTPLRVGEWSYACLVRRYWKDHVAFMRLCSLDPRYLADKSFRYSTTVVDYSKFIAA